MKKTKAYYEKRNAEICEYYESGASVKDASSKYGVCSRQIRYTLSSRGVRLRASRRKKKTPEEILKGLGLTKYCVRRLLIKSCGISVLTSDLL